MEDGETWLDLNQTDTEMAQIYKSEEKKHNYSDIVNKTYKKLFNESIETSTLMMDHCDTHNKLIALANNYYGTCDTKRCLIVISRLLKLYPTKTDGIYILHLILEDIGDKENSYICYCKHIEKSKKFEEIYLAYQMSKDLNFDIDTSIFLTKLQSFGNKREYVEEKIELYGRIYKENSNVRFFYYKKVFAIFEIMEFDGYIYKISDFVDELNQYAVKRVLTILNSLFALRKPEKEYLYEFIDYCFEYKEYGLYLQYVKADDRVRSVDDQLRILISSEECKDVNIENKSLEIDRTDFSDPYQQYLEFCIESHDLIFKDVTTGINIYNDAIYAKISDLHFCLLDLLIANNKSVSYKYVINKLIQIYQICDTTLDELTEDQIANIAIAPLDIYRNKTVLYIGICLQKDLKIDLAIELLTKLYRVDYSNEELKQILNQLYTSKGDHVTANLYEKMLDSEKKKKITSKKVLKTREKYEKIIDILKNPLTNEIRNKYINKTKKLVKKFFNNSYIYRENKQYKELKPSKYKRLKHYMKKLKHLSYKNKSKSERRKIFREFRNFHGLLFCEWHFIIKTLIFAYFDGGNYKKGMAIILRFVQGCFCNKYMRAQIDYFYNIAFIGIKAGLIHEDLGSVVKIAKKLTNNYYPLVFYLTNSFENYGNTQSFISVQRNLLRIIMRNSNNEFCDDQTQAKVGNGTLTDISATIYRKLDTQTKVRLLSAYYPRFLHKKTASMFLDVIHDDMELEEVVIISTIMLNHSLSRKLMNGDVYADAGFNVLRNAEKKYKDDISKLKIIWYNLGRAYQMVGIVGWAEAYYKKCLFGNCIVREYAFHNLSRLYAIKNAKALYFDILNK